MEPEAQATVRPALDSDLWLRFDTERFCFCDEAQPVEVAPYLFVSIRYRMILRYRGRLI